MALEDKLYFSEDAKKSKTLSLRSRKGELKRIHKGIYTNACYENIEQLVLNRWYEVVHFLYPTGIAIFRSAHELRPVNGIVFIGADIEKRRKITVASILTIEVLPGSTTGCIEPFLPQMSRSAPARQYIENLMQARGAHKKSLGREWVEARLCFILQQDNGEKRLNEIRESAKRFAKINALDDVFKKLNLMISALLSTHHSSVLCSKEAIAQAKKEPVDSNRILLFENLSTYLQRCELSCVDYSFNKLSWNNLAFFESYFSNYIEGTAFEIDEVEEIIFQNGEIDNRHLDSHDVLSVYQQVSDYQSMSLLPESFDEFITLLQSRHFEMLNVRGNKNPGKLKSKINKADRTTFVSPEKLLGTLKEAFLIYQRIPKGLASAIFMQFIIVECHPFDDGNGRLSRIMMNAELHSVGQHKIIIPTVHRDSYINGLGMASRCGDFRALVKVFFQLQGYTASINWSDYGAAREALESHCADQLPDDGIAVFNKQIRHFKFTAPLL